ncbi:MAG: hypothetical protein EBR02_04850 [Alphaproteobacteria bacterium]|nr:hypothetical protein [Alphaproteobacteria bacterium]
MQRKHKIILAAIVILNIVVMYGFSGKDSAEKGADIAAVPANGIVGGTTTAAVERAKHQDTPPSASEEGIAPSAPAAQLAPITQGAGDVVDDVPAGAEVMGEATAEGATPAN